MTAFPRPKVYETERSSIHAAAFADEQSRQSASENERNQFFDSLVRRYEELALKMRGRWDEQFELSQDGQETRYRSVEEARRKRFEEGQHQRLVKFDKWLLDWEKRIKEYIGVQDGEAQPGYETLTALEQELGKMVKDQLEALLNRHEENFEVNESRRAEISDERTSSCAKLLTEVPPVLPTSPSYRKSTHLDCKDGLRLFHPFHSVPPDLSVPSLEERFMVSQGIRLQRLIDEEQHREQEFLSAERTRDSADEDRHNKFRGFRESLHQSSGNNFQHYSLSFDMMERSRDQAVERYRTLFDAQDAIMNLQSDILLESLMDRRRSRGDIQVCVQKALRKVIQEYKKAVVHAEEKRWKTFWDKQLTRQTTAEEVRCSEGRPKNHTISPRQDNAAVSVSQQHAEEVVSPTSPVARPHLPKLSPVPSISKHSQEPDDPCIELGEARQCSLNPNASKPHTPNLPPPSPPRSPPPPLPFYGSINGRPAHLQVVKPAILSEAGMIAEDIRQQRFEKDVEQANIASNAELVNIRDRFTVAEVRRREEFTVVHRKRELELEQIMKELDGEFSMGQRERQRRFLEGEERREKKFDEVSGLFMGTFRDIQRTRERRFYVSLSVTTQEGPGEKGELLEESRTWLESLLVDEKQEMEDNFAKAERERDEAFQRWLGVAF